MHDIAVIGGGPAGMTAALYAARNGKTVLILEKDGFGGQMAYSPRIENWPGRLSVSGSELADDMLAQIMEQGVEIGFERALSVRRDGGLMTVVTTDGEHRCKAVIIAAGARHRMLGLEGEAELVGSGISFCAVCDGEFFRGQRVAVAGGGNSALQEAIMLSDICSEVVVLQDLDFLTGEQASQDILRSRKNVRIVTGARIMALLSDGGHLTGVRYFVSGSGSLETLECSGLFTAIGLEPQNGDFADVLPLDEAGYADVGEDMSAGGGVFAAGDCRRKAVRQITTAAADGAAAAVAACRYIDSAGGM